MSAQGIVLKAVSQADFTEMQFAGNFRAGGAPTVEPEVEPKTKPAPKPQPAPGPAPDRDVPLPFQPPDPGKPCHIPDGDPNRRHTVCRGRVV